MQSIQIIWKGDVFEETAIGIFDALFISGFHADLVFEVEDSFKYRQDVLYVILGLHRIKKVPNNFIAIQAEQVGSKWMTELYMNNLRRALCVWDFSPRNCSYFREKGIHCYLVPTRVPMEIFYPESPGMRKHFSSMPKDIDVLFYGARCARRERLERDFSKKTSLRVVFRYNDLFREEREDLIARSKVVLNVHYWPSASLETHRVEYLCSRGKCVLSERSSDPDLDLRYSQCVAFVKLDGMAEAAERYARDSQARADLEKKSQRQSFATQTDVSTIKEITGILTSTTTRPSGL